MNYKLMFAFLIAIIIISVNVSGYSVSIWPDEAKIESVYGTNVIQTNGDLKSNVWMLFNIPYNFSSIRDNITIYFEPWERIDNEPIKYNEIMICDDFGNIGWNIDTGYDKPCNETYNYSISKDERQRNFISQGQVYLGNYSEYRITFTPKRSDTWQSFVFRIKYTVPNFIFKQGDYYVAWLNYPNMQNKYFQIKNTLVLPTKEDVPRFIPDAQEIERVGYLDNDRIFFRWAFVFDGGGEKIVWYSNDREIREKEEELQSKYTWIGIAIGLVITIILLFFERLLFDWLPYGNKINKWFINRFNPGHVVGNVNGKKYHQIDCAYVDNITNRNMKQFKNKKDAEKEGYTACNLCK